MPGLLIWMETHVDFEPWGVLIERNGEVVAAAILTRYKRFGLWRIGKPAGPASEPVQFSVLDDEAAARLAQAICEAVQNFGGPWKVEIPDLPYPDPVVNHLLSAWPSSQAQLGPPVPRLIFAPGVPLNKYLSHNTRAAVAKARNRIKREGIQMAQEWTRDPERILKLLPEILVTSHRRDHQLRGRTLIDNAAESFFVAFVAEHSSQGLIDLLTIHLEGELAAFAVCMFDNGMYWALANRASPAWLRYSPGTIANAEVVRHAFEDTDSLGVSWGGGAQRFKLSGEVILVPRQTLYAWSSVTVCFLFQLRSHLAYFRNVISYIKKRLLA